MSRVERVLSRESLNFGLHLLTVHSHTFCFFIEWFSCSKRRTRSIEFISNQLNMENGLVEKGGRRVGCDSESRRVRLNYHVFVVISINLADFVLFIELYINKECRVCVCLLFIHMQFVYARTFKWGYKYEKKRTHCWRCERSMNE